SAVTGLVVALVAVPVALALSGTPALAMTAPLAASVEPARAVRTLTAWRDAALNGADVAGLLRLSAPESPAAHADARLARDLAGEHPTGLATAVEVVAVGGSAARPRVRTMLSQSAHERLGATGGSHVVEETSPRCVEIELTAVKERWRVHDVTACGLSS